MPSATTKLTGTPLAIDHDIKQDVVHDDDPEANEHEVDLKGGQEELRTFDPAFVKRTQRKLDLLLIPLLTMVYLCSSLDKSNLGNAKTLGMVADFGGDASGDKYALLNAFYYMSYAPFIVPLAILAKRTRMGKTLACCAVFWGIAATAFAGVNNFAGANACRFLIGLGEAGYAPLVQLYLSRFYSRQALGSRVAFWLAMAPMGGFINGIIAYGVAFVTGPLSPWRVLFLLEGGLTLIVAIVAVVILPNDIPSFRYLTAEEKDYIMYMRAMDYGTEVPKINWSHARGAFYRWQQITPAFINMAHQTMGAALGAYLPTLMAENGFKGANAQIATLGPYGAAAVSMVIGARISDHYKNRGWVVQFGGVLSTIGFLIYLVVPSTNHPARFAALILAEVGHYIAVPLLTTWVANNAGNESRRAIAVPWGVSLAVGPAVGSGYLFPAKDGPVYVLGSAICVGLSVFSSVVAGIYQFLIWRENKRRDAEEGGPPALGFRPDVQTYADEAPGYRYIG